MKLLALTLLLPIFVVSNCYSDNKTYDFGVGGEDQESFLIYFSEESDPNELTLFITKVLSYKHPQKPGHTHLSGIDLVRSIRKGKYSGVAVRFYENATQQEIGAVKDSVYRAKDSFRIVKIFNNREEEGISEDEIEDQSDGQ